MITKIIYNRVPNNATGTMGISERTVGWSYQIDHRYTKCTQIELEEMVLDKKKYYNFRVYYDCGVEHVIPYNHDIEYYDEADTVSEQEPTEQD